MKVNHKAPKKNLSNDVVIARVLQREVEKLRAANKNAVDRAIALQRKVESLEKQCAEYRAKWEATHAKVGP